MLKLAPDPIAPSRSELQLRFGEMSPSSSSLAEPAKAMLAPKAKARPWIKEGGRTRLGRRGDRNEVVASAGYW